jgi:hypothetical protein
LLQAILAAIHARAIRHGDRHSTMIGAPYESRESMSYLLLMHMCQMSANKERLFVE